MPRLEGRTAIITGAAHGMGAATARHFASQGAKLVLADIEIDPLNALAAELGQAADVIELDVSSENNWNSAAANIAARVGRIDILVNNAGYFVAHRLAETSLAEFEQVVRVNQTSCFLGMKIIAPLMRSGGSIINVSSAAGLRGSPGMFAYAAAKWAVRGMTKAAALELAADGIRVNSIHPGAIATRMILGNPPDVNDAIVASTPLARMGEAEEIAALVVFLASEEAAYITGAEFAIDGGVSV